MFSLIERLRRPAFAVVLTVLGAVTPMVAQSYQVTASPSSYTNVPAHTTRQLATFTVKNLDDGEWLHFSCLKVGDLVCEGTSVDSFFVGLNQTIGVTVKYTSGAASGSGTIGLRVSGVWGKVSASASVAMGSPRVTFTTHGVSAGGTFDVHTRRPVLRAEYTIPIYQTDTLLTTASWRGASVSANAQRYYGMVEWEVDSNTQLALADSVPFEVTFCKLAAYGGECSTEKVMVRLPNDQKPLLDFTGIPRGTWGGGFNTPLGSGIGLEGAEVETGFSTVPYVYRGSPRSASMVYSTRTSYPRAIIPVNLELPWPATTPDQVKVVLFDGAVRLDSTLVTSTLCGAVAGRCRTVLQGDFSGTSFATPTRKWLRVEVSVTSGATVKQSSDSVEVVLVDRRTTQYGSGWWPAVQSKLVASGYDRILVAANGAATVFRSNALGAFLSPPGSTSELFQTASGWELRPRGTLARIVFDSAGRLVKVVDPDGNRDSLSYVGWTDTLTAIRDPKNNVIAFGYNSTTRRLETVTSLSGLPGARVTRVTIDTANLLVTDSLAAAPNRPRSHYLYERIGTLSQKTVLLRGVFGILGTDSTTVLYDSTGSGPRRPLAARMAPVSAGTPVIGVTLYERQGWHALRSLDSVYVEVKDPRNNWTRSLLNRYAQSLRSWDSLGLLARAQYDALGRILWSEGKNGDSSRVYTSYDTFGRVARTYIVRSASDTLRLDSLVYDASHRVVKRIDSRNQADSAAYDGEGHLVYTRDPAGNVTRFRYTADGLRDSVQAPGQTGWSRVTFDTVWKNVYQSYNVDGRLEQATTYDAMGRAAETRGTQATTVSSGSVVWRMWRSRTRYNGANEVDSTSNGYWTDCTDATCTAPSGSFIFTARSERRPNTVGRDSVLVQWVGGVARKSRVRFDRLGQVTASWPYADSTAIRDSMVYDIAGNLVKRYTRRGDSLTSVFDSRNRDTLTTIPGVGNLRRTFGGPNDQLTRLWYDGKVDPIGGVNGERGWAFDARGRLTDDILFVGTTETHALYTYDNKERLAGVTDGVISREFRYETVRGIADTMITSEGDTLAMAFDGQGRMSTSTLRAPSAAARWITTTRSYKQTGELMSQFRHLGAANPADTFDVGSIQPASWLDGQYQGSALMEVYTFQDGAGQPQHVESGDASYDAVNRLSSWVGKRDSVVQATVSYLFDEAGNISPAGESRVYDTTTNRLLTQVANGHRYRHSYDRAGNLVTKLDSLVAGGFSCEWQYGYDVLDRLVLVKARASSTDSLWTVARYAYDVLGNRIVRRVYASPCVAGVASGYTRYAVWDGQVRFEADQGGTITKRYVWGPGTDNLLVADNGSGTTRYFAITDKLGSVRAWVQQNGTWKQRLRYDPYGNVIPDTLSGTSPGFAYGWTGREYDEETGFYFLRARYYDPTVGRFTQEDPIGEAGGSNRYAYVGGQPLEARDPTGLIKSYETYMPNTDQFAGWLLVMGMRSMADGMRRRTNGRLAYLEALSAYDNYTAAFAAEQQRWASVNCAGDAECELKQKAYASGQVVSSTYYALAFEEIALLADVSSTSLGSQVEARFMKGLIFRNDRTVEAINRARNLDAVAWSIRDITIVHGASGYDAAWTMVHEQYHVNGLGSGFGFWAAEVTVNRATRQALGRDAEFPWSVPM